MRSLLVLVLMTAACHPRLSMGTDMSASTRGPLAHLEAIPRLAGVPNVPAPAPPAEGRNVSAGIAFGDRKLTVGVRLHANHLSGSTLDVMSGPRYMSAAAAVDFRYAVLRVKGVSAVATLAPTTNLLVDSARGSTYYGQGIRYGGGLAVTVLAFSVYADVYQEKLFFGDGPGRGNSERSGLTVGLAFQP